MANIALWSAAAALAATVVLIVPLDARGGPNGTSGEGSVPAKPQRAIQIEPMVDPVKRVAPKTPDLGPASADVKSVAKGRAAKADKSPRKVDLVGAKPNCDHGYTSDAAGKSCIKIPAGKAKKKSGKKR